MPDKKSTWIIIGAGAAGQEVVEQLRTGKRTDIEVVGFVDDDKTKQDSKVVGIPILGRIDDLPRLVGSHGVDEVLISVPSLGGEFVKRIMKLVPPNLPIKVLPSIVLLGTVDLSLIRNINPSDLIGRPLVKSAQLFIADKAEGKTFLVTGGAGSIGNEIVRQLYYSKAEHIIIVDSWEEGVFNLLQEIEPRHKHKEERRIQPFIGNIRDRGRIDEIMSKYKIDVVIHAAAYKHVPLMEDNKEEAKKTNYIGTKNVLDLTVKHKIKDFVLISTDKAVNPANVMGRTKRQAELLVKQFAKKHKDYRFCAVRFGNVLNSSGSVVPIFVRQIKNRLPVTVTHKDMTRYFMSIPEAVSLVLLSWILSKNGQILVLDMGEPIRIMDLAIDLIKFYGLEPYKDIDIVEIGIRPGEKIHEELAYDKRRLKPGPMERIFIAEEL